MPVPEFADITCNAAQEATATTDSRAGSYSDLGIPSDDLSLQEAGAAGEATMREQDAEVKPALRRHCCCRAVGCCLCMLLVALGVCMPIFWPRPPSWELTKLDLVDSTALDPFIRAFVPGGDISSNVTLPEVSFMAEVDLYNPNHLGGSAEEGKLTLFHAGQQLGTGHVAPTVVPPRSTVKLLVNMSIEASAELLDKVSSALVANDLKLDVQVSGTTSLRWPLGIRLHCAVDCDVQASVVELMVPEARRRVVESQDCSYRYL